MSRRKYTKLSELTASEGLERFRRNDSLVHRKLLSYLPFMIATNLATLLLSTVDGVVVGNLVGSEALSANGGRDVRNQLMIKFFPDSCIFTIMDDGRCIMLDEDEETKELIANYSMIRKTASSVKYQYILNLNYTVFCFA